MPLLDFDYGVLCSGAIDAGKLMGYWNLAWYAFASPEWTLGDTTLYNTLVRVTSPYDRLATSLVKLFNYYEVENVFLWAVVSFFSR